MAYLLRAVGRAARDVHPAARVALQVEWPVDQAVLVDLSVGDVWASPLHLDTRHGRPGHVCDNRGART